MSEANPYRIEILSVACDLLEHLLSARGRPQGLADIARQLGINSSRAIRILKTLQERGYVEKDPQTQGYLLGIRFLEFAWVVGALLPVFIVIPEGLGLTLAGLAALAIQVVYISAVLVPVVRHRRSVVPQAVEEDRRPPDKNVLDLM